MYKTKDLFCVRKDIKKFVGFKVKLTSSKGRKKTGIKEGIIENAYDSIFIVRLSDQKDSGGKLSFSYADVLTKAVEITVCH